MKNPFINLLEFTGWIFRKTPYFRGKDFIGRNILKPVISRLDPEFIVPLESGTKIICRPKDWIPWTIYLYGCYIREDLYEQFMLNKSEECGTIFDIGANIGYYSIQFGEKSDVVYAFEPMEYQYNELQRNLEINSLTNIHTVKKIVSNTSGRERIYFSGFENTGKSSLVKKTNHFEDISSVTLDKFCEELKIDNIDLIKIDVEGYEFKVLDGLKNMLKLKNVTHIFVELLEKNLNKAGSSSGEICDLLDSYGYSAYSIKTGECKPYKRGDSESLVSLPLN